MKKHHTSVARILGVAVLTVSLVAQAFPVSTVSAAQITNRSLTLMSGGSDSDGNGINDGGSMPGGIANHMFEFDLSGGTVGSIRFQYCTTAAPVPNGIDCDVPAGMNASGAALGNQSGTAGFSVGSTTTNTVVLTRPAAGATVGAASYRLDAITNPTDTNKTFFVRISTHASIDATDTAIDTGTVAASTANAIELDGTMPESLVFCTGATIDVNDGDVPDCATATSGAISFDKLFSPTETAKANSQMAASTNAGQGYAISVHGPTLTSGSNTIAAMSSTTTGIQGTPQFGINLVENIATAGATPADPFGANITQTGGALYTGGPTTDYATADSFKFANGEAVSESAGGSDAQIYTVSYIANVPGSQPAGTYSTTLTYICTPTF